MKKNIVLLLTDDLGIGDLGVYGQDRIETPNIDELALNGMLFTNHYCSPWCVPSRASFLEAKHPGNIHLRNRHYYPNHYPILIKNFQENGYVTGMFGKWGLSEVTGGYRLNESYTIEGGDPTTLGFDEYVGFLTHRDAHVHFLDNPENPLDGNNDHPYYEDIRRTLFSHNGKYIVEPDTYVNNIFLTESLSFISRHKNNPFFLYLPLTLPHAELVCPNDAIYQKYLDENGNSIFPEKSWQGNRLYKRFVKFPKATYAAMVTCVDRTVSLIVEHLKSLGLFENTIIVFSSDNGTHNAGGRTIEDITFFDSTGGLRGNKFSMFEGGVKTPLIFHNPTLINKGISDALIGIWDILPTLLDLVEIPISVNIDGISLKNILRGEESEGHDFIRLEENLPTTGLTITVRDDNYKLLRTNIGEDNESLSVYNLAEDPKEQVNILFNPEIRKEINWLIAQANLDRTDMDEYGQYPIPFQSFLNYFPTKKGTTSSDYLSGSDVHDYIIGDSGDDTILGNKGTDILQGWKGSDLIYGGKGSDILRGGKGADTLYGDKGDDVIFGDKDDDVIVDLAGDNTYHYSRGDGVDTLITNGGRLILHDIDPNEVTAEKIGSDLILYLPLQGRIIIKNYVQDAWIFFPALLIF